MTAFAINEKNLPRLLETRCNLTGLSRSLTRPVMKDFQYWLACNGPEYTVQRFKTIKQVVINYVAYDSPLPKDIWMKKKNKYLLHGVYGRLQKVAKSGDKGLQKVCKLLNVYTLLCNVETTEKSIQKFRHTVESPGPTSSQELVDLIRKATRVAVNHYDLPQYKISYAEPYELAYDKKPHQEASWADQIQRIFRCADGIKLISDPVIFNPMLNCLGFRGYKYYSEPLTMGRIFRIPSPGLKDRWVCDFYKPLEHCIKPMGIQLYRAVEKLPWDITYREDKCFAPIQEHLRQGKVINAFDLSSATDRFPWDLQHNMLKVYNLDSKFQEMVSMYAKLVRLPAEMPDGTLVTWSHGQPLGAYPSFATFTLTHGLLLFGLNGFKWDNDFFVHGDDVVILNENLAQLYYNCMQELQVDISLFKSVRSNRLTEINSKIISANRVLTIPKWKPITRKNALSSIKNWGLGILKFLRCSDDERHAIRRIAGLPIELGGAGVNPDGTSLDERMSGLEDLFIMDKELAYAGSSRRRVMRRFLSDPNMRNIMGNALVSAERFDQKRLGDIDIKIYNDYRDLDILGKNIYSVNPDLDVPVDPPVLSEISDEITRCYLRLKKIV